jgi:alcohol dehydrogenase (cytochrome c)
MNKVLLLLALSIAAVLGAIPTAGVGEVKNFSPVTQKMLENPGPDDWLMYSRTYDAQRFSPLKQITKENVGRLKQSWSRVFGAGSTETIPTVYQGVMYLTLPGSIIQAIDASNGEVIWEYQRQFANRNAGAGGRSKTLAIYQDLIFFTAPDSHVVALDARTGAMRWEAKTDTRGHTSGPIVVEGKVISGGACSGNRANCYIAAHDALTGKEEWRFYTTPAPGEPGDETWGGASLANRQASTWGLPGSYDPVRKLLYWGIANPMPDQRSQRHDGNPDAVSR